MSWRDNFGKWFGRKRPPDGARTSDPAKWLAPDATPFGVPVLDLISVTGGTISTSKSAKEAEMSISWDRKTVDDLGTNVDPIETIACDLRYLADDDLPEGWLFTPSQMEQKWVIGYRQGRILLARSWTGDLKAIADTRRDGAELVVERLHVADGSLSVFGDAIQIFDWMLRSHALGQILPLPVREDAAQLLESIPLSVFSHFGNVARCAATSWEPAKWTAARPVRPLRATSAIITAVRMEKHDTIASLAAAGHSLDARSPIGGYTALHVAAVKKSLPLTRQLLELGADPNVLADRQASVLITAIVHKCPLELLELLAAHGAEPTVCNEDGFGALHALAEIDHPETLSWLLSKGLDLEQKTRNGHTPLQIAAALGHVNALNALLEAGANPSARSAPGTTARDIAVAEGKNESVAALDAWRKSRDRTPGGTPIA
jgi:hypothetical protein